MIIVRLDLSDLYHRVNRKFGRKLNFEAVLKRFGERGNVRAIAYGIQKDNEASGFISCLQRLGIDTRFKRPEIIKCGDREIKRANWDLGIGMDVVKDMEDRAVSEFILGTGSNSMVPLAHHLSRYGYPITVFGCGIGRELRACADTLIEVSEELLE